MLFYHSTICVTSWGQWKYGQTTLMCKRIVDNSCTLVNEDVIIDNWLAYGLLILTTLTSFINNNNNIIIIIIIIYIILISIINSFLNIDDE